MKLKLLFSIALCFYAALSLACKYIVLPEGLEDSQAGVGSGSRVWIGIVTGVGTSETGDLHIDIALRNDTGDWATMHAVSGKPAALTANDGKTTNCETVFIGTGGHRLAPGFQMRGYTTGAPETPEIQRLYVECTGISTSAGAQLRVPYVSFGGNLDDYDPEANQTTGTLELNLDEVVADLVYPIAAQVEGLILPIGTPIVGLSDNVVTLLDAVRTADGFDFTWQNENPTKFPLKTHIGTPPVIGADGIIYGVYETLDIPPVPITPSKEKMQWTTTVSVPAEASGFYILLSVESKKPRTYVNYVVDISGK